MKLTKLSLVAALAVSAAFAGGDIAPVEPVVEAPAVAASCGAKPGTTIAGKLQGYYYTDDSSATYDMFSKEASQLGLAATLDVSHAFNDWLTANFTAVGFVNALKKPNAMYMEGSKNGAFFNVANLTANFEDTTFIAGRQILDTPMVKSFDWLLSPEGYEAYTLVNKSISNVTLVGSYINRYRPNSTGDNFVELNGDNWTVGASYSDAFDASVWYYNVDNGSSFGGNGAYTQIYADAGTEFAGIGLAAQFVSTNYDAGKDSTAFGVKASTSVGGVDLMAAYNNVSDRAAGGVSADGFYTSSWNSTLVNQLVVGNAYKLQASTEFSGLSATASYAYFEDNNDDGSEIDLILGYALTDDISLDAIYTNSNYLSDGLDAINTFELIGTYTF